MPLAALIRLLSCAGLLGHTPVSVSLVSVARQANQGMRDFLEPYEPQDCVALFQGKQDQDLSFAFMAAKMDMHIANNMRLIAAYGLGDPYEEGIVFEETYGQYESLWKCALMSIKTGMANCKALVAHYIAAMKLQGHRCHYVLYQTLFVDNDGRECQDWHVTAVVDGVEIDISADLGMGQDIASVAA